MSLVDYLNLIHVNARLDSDKSIGPASDNTPVLGSHCTEERLEILGDSTFNGLANIYAAIYV